MANVQDAYLNQLYQILPEENREAYYNKLIAPNSVFDFKEVDNLGGIMFKSAIINGRPPITEALGQIVEGFEKNYDNLRESAKVILQQYLNELGLEFPDPPQEGGRRRKSRKTRRRCKSKSKSRRRR